MKLSIEQIRVYEAFENKTAECPMCLIQNEYERQLIEVILGEMVMDSEFYAKVGNEFSFCKWHFEKLNRAYDKLGLALILDKIIDIEINNIEKSAQSTNKDSLIYKIFKLHNKIRYDNNQECFICNKIHTHIIDNIGILIHLWIRENDFKTLYKTCKGYCKNHYLLILSYCNHHNTYETEINEFIEVTKEIQNKSLKELQKEIQWFIKKFDYLNADAPWGTSKDAVQKALKKIVGYKEEP